MENKIVDFLKSKGISVLQGRKTDKCDVQRSMEVWYSWYCGHVDTFHNYKVYTGQKMLNCRRLTLDMAGRVCQRWADLLLNEKVDITVSDEYTHKRLQRILRNVNFPVRGNNLIELAFAVGGGFFVQYWDGGTTGQKYISQQNAYPISYDNGRLTEIAFASKKTVEGNDYYYLETHTLDGEKHYVIDNFLLCNKGENGELCEVSEEFYERHGLITKWETHSNIPLFQQVRPNVANRDDFDSPFGRSVYAGATDILKSIDCLYDSFHKEFILGKKRIFVTEGVMSVIEDPITGEQRRQFDPNDEVFYRLFDMDGGEGKDPITEVNPQLRVGEHNQGLQTQLDLLAQAVGLGEKEFKWESGSVSTATQIISENSKQFRTLKKHETLLEEAIVGMVRGLLFVEKTFSADAEKNKIKYDAEVTVNFDDSIIEDTSEIRRQALLELNAGVIDEVEYYMITRKLSEEQAIALRDSIKERRPKLETEPNPEGDPE